MAIYLLISFIVGMTGGVLLKSLLLRPRVSGVVNIDRSDPDGPYLFLELEEGIHELSMQEYVKFRVQNKNYISSE